MENDIETKIFNVKTDYYGTIVNYSALFDPGNLGQQVESIKIKIVNFEEDFVKARHLIKINQFYNLHSITVLIKISSVDDKSNPNGYKFYVNYNGDYEILANKTNEALESFSNSFQPLFSELNTSIERIELNCCGLLNINTFSNLLNNKSIKYLNLYVNSDFIVYSLKPNVGSSDGSGGDDSGGDDLILNNIFKLQLYSLIFEFNESVAYKLVGEFIKEFKNLINYISKQQQQQHKSNSINLKEIKIIIKHDNYIHQELNNIHNPYFTTILKLLTQPTTPLL
ncbi:hypothetical protein ACTFIR_012081 [Dictyostelium discoideum]